MARQYSIFRRLSPNILARAGAGTAAACTFQTETMILHFIWQWFGTMLMVGTCLWALWRGEAPERWGGGILVVGLFLSIIVQMTRSKDVYDGLGYVLVDVAALIAFVTLSLWSRRIWTLFISAFQLNAVISHFAQHLSSHVDIYTQITAVVLWSGYGLTFALMAGMWGVERRRARLAAR